MCNTLTFMTHRIIYVVCSWQKSVDFVVCHNPNEFRICGLFRLSLSLTLSFFLFLCVCLPNLQLFILAIVSKIRFARILFKINIHYTQYAHTNAHCNSFTFPNLAIAKGLKCNRFACQDNKLTIDLKFRIGRAAHTKTISLTVFYTCGAHGIDSSSQIYSGHWLIHTYFRVELFSNESFKIC